jgi:hypothetical protein
MAAESLRSRAAIEQYIVWGSGVPLKKAEEPWLHGSAYVRVLS